ncbi:MAG: class I SAM-dependent methyltransferase [Candidatus Limivivens sp.]|nr:class I SAM-dependent methyltransferase [Candidatus Limivivens sp.]
MQEKIGKITLDYTYYPGEDLYSDGAIEDELLETARECQEREYPRVIAEKKSWPFLYHFSPIRQNIVSWIPFQGTDSVLEIGAGCGAITGALAQKCGQVTCVELSKKRSQINAWRNREYENVTIMVGNFLEVEKHLPETFDYITLIGVFEYAESYMGKDHPAQTMLRCVARHLAPGGKIIIAIENRLGLKYWAGCGEDHVGRRFEGLEGYHHTTGVRTYSKMELQQVIDQSGEFKTTFYYPYPDYKFPYSIYSDRYLPRKGELKDNTCNFDMTKLTLFDEARVFDTLIDNGLFPLFSNSFLVMIEKEEAK